MKEDNDILAVRKILDDVKKKGDKAVKYYTNKFDNQNLSNLEVSNKEIRAAYKKVKPEFLIEIKKAAKNIRKFAKKQYSQLRNMKVTIDGNIIGQRIVPIEKVGCYVPGGRYPLPSTALMLVIPAKVAKVKEIIVCSPKISPETIVAADIAGANKIFRIGGVQAIGAMAYGTKTIEKVDKIVGPGNKYVNLAKKEVYGKVGIDFIAGPSEVLIISDNSSQPEMIAADLLAQLEHDNEAIANLITTSKEISKNVRSELKKQIKTLKTKSVIKESIKNTRIIVVDSLLEAVKLSNEIAPEHLELQVKNPNQIIKKLTNYGSLFIGKYSAEVFGDYCSGTNHVLPTKKVSRYSGGLSVKDFLKILTFQKLSKKGAERLAKITSVLAEAEGLDAHKKAAEIRVKKKEKINKTNISKLYMEEIK